MADKPTVEQIKAEVDALTKMKPTVRRFSALGEDNHASIDAQVQVLADLMSREKIYDLWETEDEEDEDGNEDNCVLDCALLARSWLDGEADSSPPSTGWQSLVQVT